MVKKVLRSAEENFSEPVPLSPLYPTTRYTPLPLCKKMMMMMMMMMMMLLLLLLLLLLRSRSPLHDVTLTFDLQKGTAAPLPAVRIHLFVWGGDCELASEHIQFAALEFITGLQLPTLTIWGCIAPGYRYGSCSSG